jgi:hypothetical protein
MRLQDERGEMLLKQVLELVNEACVFVHKFQDRSYPLKAWKINTDKATFEELNGRLLEAVGDLQLGLHVDVEEQLLQDTRDAQGDVQEVLELAKNSMREREELTNKVLAEIERAEHEQIGEISRIVQRIKKAAQDNTDMKAAVLSLQAGDAPRSGIKPIRLNLLECKEDETNLIGSGTYGFVYRGTYQEMPVAVKVVRIASCGSSARSNMENEILVHQLPLRDSAVGSVPHEREVHDRDGVSHRIAQGISV